MYKLCDKKKLTRLIICDFFLILTALAITNASNASYKTDEPIFLPIIMYHSIVSDTTDGNEYQVNVSTIESDLKYLSENGYNAVFIEEVADYVFYNKPLPENPVCITADDGFYNNSCYLLPLLKKYDMKATISVVGYFSEVISENDPHIPEYSYLTWEDISALIESDRIEIGNHTYNMHSLNDRKGCSKLFYESEEEYSKKFIEDVGTMQTLLKMNTGITPIVFTYPFGAISDESIPLLKELGFSAALNCREKPNYITHDESCLFTLNRYNRASGISTNDFMKKILCGKK